MEYSTTKFKNVTYHFNQFILFILIYSLYSNVVSVQEGKEIIC
jgi:hypothetical protein